MHGAATVTLLAPGLLESAAGGEVHCPALQGLLTCALRERRPPVSPVRQLCTAFDIHADAAPVAALTRQYDCGDAGADVWIRADPVHVEPGYQGVLHIAWPDLDAAEAEALAAATGTAFESLAEGPSVGAAGRWYLRLQGPPAFSTQPPTPVCALSSLLPSGPQSGPWHPALNLAQMILHNHEVNHRRVQRGGLSVDSLWLWGGGSLPAAHAPGWKCVYGEADALVCALAAHYALPLRPLPTAAATLHETAGPILVVLNVATRTLPEWEQDWFQPLWTALKRRALTGLCLHTATWEFRITPGSLWRRFWRRPRPLSAWLPD